jgi:2-oxoisovalerate dehydrogenase E1 component alpha subunit
MPESDVTVQLLTPAGELAPSDSAEEFLPYFERLTEDDHSGFLRDMRLTRAFDLEATNLQRQGHLGLWAPSTGQEAAQVGSGRATRPQDHVFPAYREHGVALIRGIDPVDIVRLMRGVTHGGWDPAAGNFHLYTLVIGSQALHATGYAMGVAFDGDVATGDPDRDTAVIAYYGDGATSQGDVSEAFVFAPVTTQSRTPLYLRSRGFGVPSTQVDGNDVFASYAVTAKHLDDARNGRGPSFIEALTYRVGAHTSSDDPTKYRTDEELQGWVAKDPIARLEAYLRNQGAPQSLFDGIDEEAKDLAADVRRRTIELTGPPLSGIFDHVYSDPHTVTAEQREWLERYEASLGGTR